MDWLTSFKKAIDYMETHMLSDIGAKMWQMRYIYRPLTSKRVLRS